MKASVLDLRYRTKDVIKAIERGETITLLYRGKEKALDHSAARTALCSESSKTTRHSGCGRTTRILMSQGPRAPASLHFSREVM